MAPSSKCLRPNCKKKPTRRGLCVSCYDAILKIHVRKKISWQELEKIGAVLPPAGREIITWVRNLQDKAKKQRKV